MDEIKKTGGKVIPFPVTRQRSPRFVEQTISGAGNVGVVGDRNQVNITIERASNEQTAAIRQLVNDVAHRAGVSHAKSMAPPTLQLLAAVPRNCHGHIEHAMEHISATDLLLAVRTGALGYCPRSQKLRRSSRAWVLFELAFFWVFVAVMVGLVFLSLYAIVFFKPSWTVSISAFACVVATYAAAHLVLIPEATALKYERLVEQFMKEQK